MQPLLNTFTGPQLRQTVYAMLGAVIVVLLIACVNVMNMQFGRAALRAKELAIRGALGATRWRIVRQMLTESFLVAAFGAIVGVALAYWAVGSARSRHRALPFPLPYWVQFTIDAQGARLHARRRSCSRRLLSGLVPALLSARGNAAEMMKEGGRGNSSRLVNVITRVLVVGQIALTAALLIAATLQIKSIRNQTTLELRLRRKRRLQRAHGFDGRRLSDAGSAAAVFCHAPCARCAPNPAFEGAAMTDRFRMTFANFGQYEVDGQTYVTDRDRPQGNSESVSDDYFSHARFEDSGGPRFHY